MLGPVEPMPGSFEGVIYTEIPLTAHLAVLAAIPLQIFRGGLLAIFFYPFYDTFVRSKHGWILLFGLTFGLIALDGPMNEIFCGTGF